MVSIRERSDKLRPNSWRQIVLVGCKEAAAFVGLFVLLSATPVVAETTALIGAKLYPVSGPPIESGTLVIEDGRIAARGPKALTEIPAHAKVIDVSNSVIIPGLVDLHSHVGNISDADNSATAHPELRIMDSVDVLDPDFRRVAAGGITTLNLLPGSGYLISGQGVYLKNRCAKTVEEMVYRRSDGEVAGGMKMANGTNPLRLPDVTGAPGSRAKSMAIFRNLFIQAQDYQRDLFIKARDYQAKRRRADKDPTEQVARDLKMEALVEVLEGKKLVHFHTHRHDDILAIIRLKEEFGIRPVLHHASEAYLVAEEIAAANIPVSVLVIDSPGTKLEMIYFRRDNAAILAKAGVPISFHTDDFITDSRLYLRTGALAVRGGVSEEIALRGLTLEAARQLELDNRIGSLDVGKDADFVLLSGEPFSVHTRVMETWVDGTKMFDIREPDHAAYAHGGYGVLARTSAIDGVCGQ